MGASYHSSDAGITQEHDTSSSRLLLAVGIIRHSTRIHQFNPHTVSTCKRTGRKLLLLLWLSFSTSTTLILSTLNSLLATCELLVFPRQSPAKLRFSPFCTTAQSVVMSTQMPTVYMYSVLSPCVPLSE